MAGEAGLGSARSPSPSRGYPTATCCWKDCPRTLDTRREVAQHRGGRDAVPEDLHSGAGLMRAGRGGSSARTRATNCRNNTYANRMSENQPVACPLSRKRTCERSLQPLAITCVR